MENNQVQLFENKKIRSVWDAEQEEWYFSIIDVVEALTESIDPKHYVKKMRNRDSELNANWGTVCTPVKMVSKDGKKRAIQAASIEGIRRRGGSVAGIARKALEEETGKPVITSMNAIDFAMLISDVISNVEEEKNEK